MNNHKDLRVFRKMNAALYERTFILLGEEGVRRLQNSNVLVVGVGGVGGHCAESLVRSGIGSICICDHDVVSLTNKNRQITALDSTVGLSKVRVLANRFADINRACRVTVIDAFLLPEDIPEILEREKFDCIVDAIDSVECKVALIVAAAKRGIRIFVSGGAGGRFDPSQIRFCDLFDTDYDSLMRRLRGELRKLGVTHGQVECVASTEVPKPPLPPAKSECGGRERAVNGTMSYLPPMFGMFLSSRVIQFCMDPAKYNAELAAAEKRRARKEKEEKEELARKKEAEKEAVREVYQRRREGHQAFLNRQKQQQDQQQLQLQEQPQGDQKSESTTPVTVGEEQTAAASSNATEERRRDRASDDDE